MCALLKELSNYAQAQRSRPRSPRTGGMAATCDKLHSLQNLSAEEKQGRLGVISAQADEEPACVRWQSGQKATRSNTKVGRKNFHLLQHCPHYQIFNRFSASQVRVSIRKHFSTPGSCIFSPLFKAFSKKNKNKPIFFLLAETEPSLNEVTVRNKTCRHQPEIGSPL